MINLDLLEISRRTGLKIGYCIVCDAEFLSETTYHKMGLCGSCARRAGASWVRQHTGESDALLDPDGYAEDRAMQQRRKTYRKKVISHTLRRKVFERDAYRCKKCGNHRDLSVDHVHPERHGGTLEIDNLQTLCKPCNSSKGARVE